jgi:hypothetical protein
MTDIEGKANVLLKEAATRQLMVDRLLGRSVWKEYVMQMLVPLSAMAAALFAWSAWGHESQQATRVILSGTLILVFWLSIVAIGVTSRLRLLTKILQRSGGLDAFLSGPPAGERGERGAADARA